MKKGIIGKKLGMTQIFARKRRCVIPVTVIDAGPCFVVQKKTQAETDGYERSTACVTKISEG